jgi:hypothetical protein
MAKPDELSNSALAMLQLGLLVNIPVLMKLDGSKVTESDRAKLSRNQVDSVRRHHQTMRLVDHTSPKR